MKLLQTPHDVELRTRLISYYHQNMQAEPWQRHVLWLIEYHPDAPVFSLSASMTSLSEKWTGLNHQSTTDRSKELWLRHTANPQASTIVLANAAVALAETDPAISLSLIKRTRQKDPADPQWVQWLGAEYATAVRISFARGSRIMGWSGTGGITRRPGFFVPVELADSLKKELDTSTDQALLKSTADELLLMIRGDLHPPTDEASKSDAFARSLLARLNRR
jgi:hypothetical protein